MSAEGLPTPQKRPTEETKMTRRGFLKALGIGAVGIAAEPPSVFSKPEHSPENNEEIAIVDRIRSWIEVNAEKFIVRRELSDENSIYLLELEIEGERKGETIEYTYQRKGVFPGNGREIRSDSSRIDTTIFKDDFPVGGEPVARFNEETKTWEDQRSRPSVAATA